MSPRERPNPPLPVGEREVRARHWAQGKPHPVVGMMNCAPSRMPVGQRAVVVFILV